MINTKSRLLLAVLLNLAMLFPGSVIAGGNNGITLDQAMAVVAAAQAKAEKQGILLNIIDFMDLPIVGVKKHCVYLCRFIYMTDC